nr:MAG TPA: hypothetical protein [Caudoviricetes sp.]
MIFAPLPCCFQRLTPDFFLAFRLTFALANRLNIPPSASPQDSSNIPARQPNSNCISTTSRFHTAFFRRMNK